MRQECFDKIDELKILQQTIAQLEQKHNSEIAQLRHELSIKNQIIEELQQKIKASSKQPEFFDCQETNYNSKFGKKQASYNRAKTINMWAIARDLDLDIEDIQKKFQISIEHKPIKVNQSMSFKHTLSREKRSQERSRKQLNKSYDYK